MKKIFTALFSILYLTGCSCFVPTKQNVSVMTNVSNAEIYANGQRVGTGQTKFKAKRNENVQLMAKADGYSPAYYSIGTTLSTTGILDIVGIFFFIIPFVGLITPGAQRLDENNVALQLFPNSPMLQPHQIQQN